MKKYALTLTFVIIIFSLCAQNMWQQVYDQKRARTFTQTADNRFVLTGSFYESMDYNMTIFTTDSLGNLEWDTIIPNYGIPLDIVATSDSGYIISYEESSFDNIARFIKFSANNEVIWESNISFEEDEVSIRSIVVNDDDMIIATGRTFNSPSITSILFMKLNDLGNEVWTKKYDFSSIGNSGRGIVNAYGSGYYCIGAGNGTSNLLLRIDESGDTLWTRRVGSFSNFYSLEMTTTYDSCLIFSLHNDMDSIGFLKTDSLGNELWSKKYGTNNYTYCSSIAHTYDNGLITANSIDSGNDYDLWIMKLNENGDSLYSILPPFSPYDISLTPRKIIQTKDSLFVFLAIDNNYTPRLIKTDSIGSIITPISELDKQKNNYLLCYPNPFENEVTIRFESNQTQNYVLNIYNLNGKIVFSKRGITHKSLTVNLNSLLQGTYLIELNINNEKYTSLIEKR